jgi:hypothetical protein
MTVSSNIRQEVRERANFVCEYCGVSEADTGDELTLDHYQPQSKGGSDELVNLIYCCNRCNLYKSDYWPEEDAPQLWHPRRESFAAHFLLNADGFLSALTDTGRFTVSRLHLNRPLLVAYRRNRLQREELAQERERNKQTLQLVKELARRNLISLQETTDLSVEQRDLLNILFQQEP